MSEVVHEAVVTMFSREKLCRVTAVGKPQKSYPPNRTLWIERAEDEYAKPFYVPPFCVLQRDDWMNGKDVTG